MMFNPHQAFAQGQADRQRNALNKMVIDQTRQEQSRRNKLNELMPQAIQSGDTRAVAAIDPDTATKLQSYIGSLSEQQRAEVQRKHEISSKYLATVLTAPEQQRGPAYQYARQAINSMWGKDVLPEQFDPMQVQMMVNEARKMDDILKPQSETAKPEMDLRKEFSGLTKDFRDQRAAYGRIQAAGTKPSAAGDLALIFNYMKLLDPGSVVRESEFATAQNAAGVPERVRAAYNNVLRGERLSEPQRGDFMNRSGMLFNSAVTEYNRYANRYRQLAERQQVSPDNVATPWEAVQIPEAPAQPTGEFTPAEQPGWKIEKAQ